jgi:hypothetical protein
MRAELAEKYLKANKLTATKGKHLTQVFLPYIIMDMARELESKSLGALTLHHNAKHYYTLAKIERGTFYRDFFRPFSREERDEIIESFDGFGEFIDNELQLTRVAVSNAIDFLDFDLQMTMTDIFLTEIMAQCAAIIYYDNFSASTKEGFRHNDFIENYESFIRRAGNEYYKSTGEKRKIAADDLPKVDAALGRLARKMTEFNTKI